jgi:hypothetical protein
MTHTNEISVRILGLEKTISKRDLNIVPFRFVRVQLTVAVSLLTFLKPSGHYMYRQFNIQQFYVLPTQLYLCVLYGYENKQRLFHYTALTDWFV